jgi:phosphatidylserine/phosphatidylglycerophosphate/cardiolipin synthase-like enzyme
MVPPRRGRLLDLGGHTQDEPVSIIATAGRPRRVARARGDDDRFEEWFLTPTERANPGTTIDERRSDGVAWTVGNRVEVLVDGAEYFRRLHRELCGLERGDRVHLTDWEGDPDEQLDGPGTGIATVLCDLARRGVEVRGLLWRSHPRQTHFAEQDNTALVRAVNEAGGEMVLDERVRRGGSHHQKLVLIRRADPGADVAFVGGIDLCHGRHDDGRHEGDAQAVDLNPRYGARPPWHDLQLEIRGPAVGDLTHTFRERWSDPTPLDHRNPLRAAARRVTRQPRRPDPLPPARPDPPAAGTMAVQVLRTYPAKRPPFPFAPRGERSIARAYEKALGRARRLVYLEDQYLWSRRAAGLLVAALRRSPDLCVIAVVPRYPERSGRVAETSEIIGRQDVLRMLGRAGGDRVAVYDLENDDGRPVYVHAKVCVVDDVWLEVGSDNLNRRSWTHDSEVSCAVLDTETDGRDPVRPGGGPEHARRIARDTRLRLWREHLGRADGDDADLVDPATGFAAFRASAERLEAWHRAGATGVRPPGHVRPHRPEPVPWHARPWARVVHRVFVDPDGRPRDLRRRDEV